MYVGERFHNHTIGLLELSTRFGFARWLSLPRPKHDMTRSFHICSNLTSSALRSHATICRAALPAVNSEPNLERCAPFAMVSAGREMDHSPRN
jgi:hypothetical protein